MRSKITQTADTDAEAILQEVALRIFSRPLDALPIHNIGGFVYNAVKNRIIDVMRAKKTRIPDEKNLELLWTEFAGMFYGDFTEEYPEQLKQKLKLAIEDLRPVYKDIIMAIDFDGYTYTEISKLTGISTGTLMSRRHRAISLLLKKLESFKNIKPMEYGN